MTLQAFVDAVARAYFVDQWARSQEDKGRSFSGQDIMNVAPRTPRRFIGEAWRVVGHFECAARMSIHCIIAKVHRTEYGAASGFGDDDFASKLGHYMAMQAMGHGVSWADDHKDLWFKVPHCEVY